MTPQEHFHAIFDDSNLPATTTDGQTATTDPQPDPTPASLSLSKGAGEPQPAAPDPLQPLEPISLDALGLTIVYMIQALHAAFSPGKPVILPDSQARLLPKLAKAAAEWRTLLGAGFRPSADLIDSLKQLADPDPAHDLTPPADPADADLWLRRVRKLIYHRATTHLCAATMRLHTYRNRFKSTDADQRLLGLIIRLNPPPTIQQAPTARRRHSAARTAPPNEQATTEDNPPTGSSTEPVRLSLKNEPNPQQPAPKPKPRKHPNPSKQYKTRRPLQPK